MDSINPNDSMTISPFKLWKDHFSPHLCVGFLFFGCALPSPPPAALGWLWWRAWFSVDAVDAAALCVAGVALGVIDHHFVAGVGLGDMDVHSAWQAWHLWHWAGSGGALAPPKSGKTVVVRTGERAKIRKRGTIPPNVVSGLN